MAEEAAEAKTDGKEAEIDIPISVPAEGGGEAPAEGAADATAAEGAATEGAAAAAAEGAAEAPAAGDAPAEAPADAAAESGTAESGTEGPASTEPAAPSAPADGTDATADATAETPAAPGEEKVDLEDGTGGGAPAGGSEDGKTDEPTAPPEDSKDDAAKSAVDRLSKGVEGVIGDFESGLEAIPDPSLRLALEDWAKKMNVHVQELRTIMNGTPDADPEAPAVPPLPGSLEEDTRPAVTEEEMQSVRDIGRQLASHRTGRTTQEVEEWTDPEEAAKEVEELRRVRRQIRYIFGGMLQSLPETGTLRVDDLISDAGTSEAQARVQPVVTEKPPPLPGKPAREVNKVPMPPPGKPEGHGRPRSGGTELSSVTDSSAVSWNSQVTEEEARRKEKKERKSRKHRHHSADAHADRPAKKDDGALPKPYNWAEEVVKASLDPQNQWEFPPGKAGYAGPLAGWEQPRARGPEVASKARERAEEVQRWERHHDSQQQYIFGTPR